MIEEIRTFYNSDMIAAGRQGIDLAGKLFI